MFALKKLLNSTMEEIFAIVDRITNILNSELLLPALASIFCMGEKLQKEKLNAGEKNALKNTMYPDCKKKPERYHDYTLQGEIPDTKSLHNLKGRHNNTEQLRS